MKRTPNTVRLMLENHRNRLAYIDECLRVKATVPVENQAAHIRDNPVEHFVGMAWGANVTIEELLFAHKCYHGYRYAGPIQQINGVNHYPHVSTKHPDFREWRRLYMETN
jgi:hypothetical protein